METDFDPDWPHGFTVDGKPVRVLATDLEGHLPIAVSKVLDSGFEAVLRFTLQGVGYCKHRQVYLRNAPAPKKRVKGWLNIYPKTMSYELHEFKHAADARASRNRIACIYIDVEEGDGL